MNNTVATCIVTSIIDSSRLPSHKIKGVSTKINDTNCIPVESTLEQIGCSLKTMQPDITPIMKGFIGKVEISVLRDSGCNFVIVKENLVEEEQLTGKVAFCTLADGTKRKFPVGKLNVDTPYYTGKIEALCMPEPVCDLVLGNIDGVRSPENPDVNWFHKKEGNNSSMVENKVAEAREQNKMKDEKNTLVVPSSINQIPDNELIRLHAEDISPTLIRTEAEKSDIRVHKDGSTLRGVQKKGLYYHGSKKGDISSCNYSQLVIPSKLRSEIMKIAHDRIMTGHLGIYTRQLESEDTSKNTKMSCLSEIETDLDDIGKTHISAETELHFPIYLTKKTVNEIQVNSDLDQKPTDDIRLLLGIYKDFSADTPGIREPRAFMYPNTAKLADARLRRWTLALQPYKCKMERDKGFDKVGSDFF